MKLIAQKPCSFGGKKFYRGNEIPAELVLNPKMQQEMGVLTIVEDEEAAGVPVMVEGQSFNLTPENIQILLDVLTANAEDAADLLKEVDSMDILFIVNAADSRKTVQTAAKARAQALSEAQEGAESEGEQ